MDIEKGIIGKAEMIVTEKDTALHVGSGSLPVLATPVISALMERAAVDALKNRLPDGETTVGGMIDLRHKAPTLAGKKVRAEAEVTEISGKKIEFHITCEDENGEVGEANHIRFIVNEVSFMAAAKER